MKKIGLCFLLYFPFSLFSQTLSERLTNAMNALQKDEQFKHAIISMYVVDGNAGKLIFAKNEEMGLAPASCQKLITSVAAFSLLGPDYRFKTELGYDGEIRDSILHGNLVFKGYGDPTLGSTRFSIYNNINSLDFFNQLKLFGINQIRGKVYADDSKFEFQNTPSGWVWEDLGNYFGAGAGAFNWNENTYSLPLRSGKNIGDPVTIMTQSGVQDASFINNLTTARVGSGDNANIFLPPRSDIGSIDGTIPANEERFVIKGAVPDPTSSFLDAFKFYLSYNRIGYDGNSFSSYYNSKLYTDTLQYTFKKIATQLSPSFDSINYWFLKKSINLYGEAMVKTIAYEKENFGSTKRGIELIKDFWSKNGIEKSALNILDGSGLSPANRVTTKALLTTLQYAKKQPWFSLFYNALPEMNGIKMKDGYISGVRSFTGLVKSRSSNEYLFSFIVNNFDGSPSTVRQKIWRVLDLLK